MLNYISLFSGIGAFEKALTNLGVQYELVHWCEFDKHAAKSYSLIHNTPAELNLGDITTVNESELPNVDLITYGFPCQDISLAGKQKGLFNDDGSITRSGLFFDALRIIEHCKPKIAIAENVKNLTSKKFKEQFEIVLNSLESAGYNNYWKVLNSKHYGMPQNRARVFIISIRKDIDNGFDFPEGIPLELRLKDMLEDSVDEKYYLTDKMIKYLTSTTDWGGSKTAIINKDIASTLGTGEGRRRCDSSNYVCEDLPANFDLKNMVSSDRIIQIGQIYPNSGNPQAGRIYDSMGISPSLDTCQGGNRMPKIIVRDSENIEKNQNASTDKNKTVDVSIRGRYQSDGFIKQHIGVSDREIANSITTDQKDSMITEDSLRIRRLTPIECYRLQGFTAEDAQKVSNAGVSNTQMYKQAGNSICVPVIEAIFRSLGDVYDIFTN